MVGLEFGEGCGDRDLERKIGSLRAFCTVEIKDEKMDGLDFTTMDLIPPKF